MDLRPEPPQGITRKIASFANRQHSSSHAGNQAKSRRRVNLQPRSSSSFPSTSFFEVVRFYVTLLSEEGRAESLGRACTGFPWNLRS